MVSARQAVASILSSARSATLARESRIARFAASAGMLCVLTASLSWGPQAHAQEAAAAAPGAQLEEVTVTGSRIKRTSDFTTPTPTTVLDTSTMENAGIVNVGQALQMAPANISTMTPSNTGNSSFFTGAYIPNLRGLNPFFGTRTLTLIDTQRAVQTTQGDSFDLNFIPQVLVQRIDTVTGGGSAAYGSGAISGVINVILDRNLEGGKVNGDLYQTNYGDGRDRHIGAAYGFGVADNRVHIVLGGEYERQDGVGCQDVRSWCGKDAGFYQSGVAGTANIATYSLGSNLHSAGLGYNGTLAPYGGFSPAPLSAPVGQLNPLLQASPDGTGVIPFLAGATPYAPYGPGTGATPSSTVVGGDGTPLYQYTNLMSPTTRGIITALVTAKVTDSINFKLDLNWGKVESNTQVIGNEVTGTSVISPDNAYLGGAGSPLSNAVSGGYTALYKDWNQQLPLFASTSTTLKRVTAGLDGTYGQSSWTWDGYVEYGLTQREQLEPNESRYQSMNFALDSVTDPVTGQPTCRVSLPGGTAGLTASQALLAQGCQPLNPFGTGQISQAAQNYAFGALDERLRYTQTVAAFNSSGNIYQGIGAGPFSLAAGAEWRQEVGHNDDNDLLGTGCLPTDDAATCTLRSQDFQNQFGTSFGGQTTVEEGYLELNLPLAKDLPFAHLLNLDVSARESHYQTDAFYGIAYTQNPDTPREGKHNLFTWKASLAYEPVEGIRFRASQSRDARAANFREMYYGQAVNDPGFYGFCVAPTVVNTFTTPCTGNLFGNVNLAPETSDTTTAGIVLTPTQLPGLQFSADFIHIHISNAISAASTAFTVQSEIATGGPTAAGNINFDSSCGSTANCLAEWQAGDSALAKSVTALAYNGSFYDERGTDFSVSYLLPSLPDGSSLFARALTTWTTEQKYQAFPGSPTYNILGQTGSVGLLTDYTPAARWRGNMSLTWTKGMLSLTPSMSWVGHGTLSYAGVTPSQTSLYNLVANNDKSIQGFGYVLLPYNYVPSYFKFDLNATVNFDNVPGLKNLQLYTQINNVLNKAPPIAAAPGGFFASGYAGTNPVYFDTLGLAYRVGFRLSF